MVNVGKYTSPMDDMGMDMSSNTQPTNSQSGATRLTAEVIMAPGKFNS